MGKIAAAKLAQNSADSRNSSTSSWQEEPGVNSMDISTGHMVLSYMEDHLKNKQRLEQEWVGLCAYEAEPNATSIAFKVENKKKNRYPDKLPYDHNRVIPNALVNGSNSDYINASTVMDHDPRNPAYIITQGPMTHTVADFWQMVWEQGSVVIVMLSKLSENGYQLCHRYWPEEGSEQYHIFEVHLVSEHVWCEDYLVRSLYLKNSQTGETRTVTQFHFLSWPDGNIPTSTKAILEFRRKVNKSYRGRSCPMILHCSDGVGRAGTYVLIDMVLNRMTKGSKEIDIAATLEHIRDQRAGMVQTRSQFEFCHIRRGDCNGRTYGLTTTLTRHYKTEQHWKTKRCRAVRMTKFFYQAGSSVLLVSNTNRTNCCTVGVDVHWKFETRVKWNLKFPINTQNDLRSDQ